MRIFISLALLACLALSSLAPPALAQEIKKIIVKGNQRIEEETIRSFINVREGDPMSNLVLDEALKNSFATGLFADVKIEMQGNNLIVKVVENPIINEVAFEGNKRIEDEVLEAEIKLIPRAIYTKSALQKDVKRILDIYQQNGRFSTLVTPKVIKLEQNRVNLVFEVDEGQKTKITKINFVGNKHFSDGKLREVIQSKEESILRFFSSDDNYDPDRIALDKELLRRHYVSKGHADFKVTSATAELTPEREAFHITFSLEEGDRYTFGDMNVTSELPEFAAENLSDLLVTQAGETFDADHVEESIEALTKELGNMGYAFVKIDPQFGRNPDTDIIAINYVIKEGPRVYVEKININGNVRTLDKVVRREFRVAEGDPYNAAKIKRSQQRTQNLGFFKKVDIKNVPGSAPDKVEIDVDVEEQSTGELSIGAGFSTTDGALGDIGITERNLLGKGQNLRLNFTVAASRQEIDFSFTEPHFMDRDFAAGIDIFKIRRDGTSSFTDLSFDRDSLGFALRGTYPLTEHLKHTVRYSLRTDDITNVEADASTFIKRQEGETATSLVGHSLIYDKRDSRFSPTEGYYVRFNQDIAGLGGDAKHFMNELRGAYFYPTFNNDWVLKLAGKGGYIFGLGDEDVLINNRFFLGPNEIRGFNNNGIGPRDLTTLDPLGGNIYYVGTAEYTFPLGLPEELGFKGAVFTDAGSLYEVDDSGASVVDSDSLRVSVGVGLAWNSPFGPIRIDFSEAVEKEDFDETEVVRFSFGTAF